MSPAWRSAALAAALLGAGCTVGPDYHRPAAAVPSGFKELVGWKIGTPRDAMDRGAWWSIYNDPILNQLAPQIDISNQTLASALANYDQAQAIVYETRAGGLPGASVLATASRLGNGTGAHGLTRSSATVDAAASWDLDVWGRIRRGVESDVAFAQASAADLALARLSAQVALAQAYFNLRAADSLTLLLQRVVGEYEHAAQITRNQYAAGVAARSDVITAEAQVQGTQAQLIAVGVQRAQYEHAIAVLIGRPPAELTITPGKLQTNIPVVPPVLPSLLLERRPDIAAAERTMQQQNALIGVAVATFYPDVTLSAVFGYAGNPGGALLNVANQFWSVATAAVQPVFDGGLRTATLAAARASYDQSVASYRQTVLVAFQQVEDELSALRILADQAVAEEAALQSARRASAIALNEYQSGTVAYTAVIIAQATELADEQAVLAVRQNRLLASVTLIGALGGGWDAALLPPAQRLQDGAPFVEPRI